MCKQMLLYLKAEKPDPGDLSLAPAIVSEKHATHLQQGAIGANLEPILPPFSLLLSHKQIPDIVSEALMMGRGLCADVTFQSKKMPSIHTTVHTSPPIGPKCCNLSLVLNFIVFTEIVKKKCFFSREYGSLDL